MDTDYKRNPPILRTESTETVFDNEIFVEEIQEENAISCSSVPPVQIRDKPNDEHTNYNLANFEAYTKEKQRTHELLDEDICAECSSLPMKTAPIARLVDKTKPKRESSHRVKGIDDVTAGPKQKRPSKDVFKDNMTQGWTLNEDDLLCLPLVLNKDRAQEYSTRGHQQEKGQHVLRKRQTFGGQILMMTYEKIISQMRYTIKDKCLVPHDVYPDGNCMFAAIVDQLRVRGDFSFTMHTLRQSAVNYLKENPTTDDGTPLKMFLTDEKTWEEYLLNMTEDGTWGDHIILGALTNVISKRIIIYGGTTGERETILCPTALTHKNDVTDDQVLDDGSVVYLGHVGESHYVSLRPTSWRQNLNKGMHTRRMSSETAPVEDSLDKCPVDHINFILRQLFRMGLVDSFCSDDVDTLIPNRIETNDDITEIFGSMICKLVPCNVKLKSFGSLNKKEESDTCSYKAVYVVFQTPRDTNIVSTTTSAKSIDLVAENSEAVVGQLKLIPKTHKLWRGQTTTKHTTAYLKTFEVNFNWSNDIFSSKLSNNSIDMHHVLAFQCIWPDVADEWQYRHRESGFPDDHTVKTVVASGCHVIPLTSDTRMSDIFDDPVHFMASVDDDTWCYSFAAAEKEICRFLSSEQRKSFLVFKALVENTLNDIPLPVSIVKSVFFYACENIKTSSWKSKPGECLLILLKKIVECLKKDDVPHYFMSEKNLLNFISEKNIDECYRRLECARLQPMVTLYFLLDQITNIYSSEIGCFIDEIIENINLNAYAPTAINIASHNLLAVSRRLLKDCVLQKDYQTAFMALQDIVEEKENSLEKNGCDLIKSIMWGLHISHPWCFALYVDIKLKTSLTLQMCEGYGTIHVTDVFGPGCVDELPDTLVPDCFNISRGDLRFAAEVYEVLLQAVSGTTLIKCMKYYLKRYGELAGDGLILPYVHLDSMNSSNSGTGRQNMIEEMSSMLLLNLIYVNLFNFCEQSYRVEQFREMMPAYTLIAERTGRPLDIRNIRAMWSSLDASEEAESWKR